MSDAPKKYVVIVQCHIVKQRCSGYLCELAAHRRTGGFSHYPEDAGYRTLTMTCGGCCGRAVQRKLSNVVKMARKQEGIEKDDIAVHLSSCITRDNFHGPPCPHLDYLKVMIADKLGLDVCEDTNISEKAEERRRAGVYAS